MLVTWSFLAICLIIGFIFLGIKMSESIAHGDIKMFFFALYAITLLTIFNIISSFYFYNRTLKKRGKKGIRGLQGKVGNKGDNGYCKPLSCKKESLKMLLLDIYKQNRQDDTEIEDRICRFFKDTQSDSAIESLTIEKFKEIKNNIENNFESLISDGGNLYCLTKEGSEKETVTINISDGQSGDPDPIQLTLQDFC